jgi:hypothetical protein
MKKVSLIILTGMFLSCGSTNPKYDATMVLKDGTSVEGLMTDPSHYVAGGSKTKLSIKTTNGKITHKSDEIEKITMLGENKFYIPIYARKFLSFERSGKLKYAWLTPVEIPKGKASLYSGQVEQTNQNGRYIGASTAYYVWKRGDEAASFFTASDVVFTIGAGNVFRIMIENVFSDCPELVKKAKDEKYKVKIKSAIDVVNEYNSICGK